MRHFRKFWLDLVLSAEADAIAAQQAQQRYTGRDHRTGPGEGRSAKNGRECSMDPESESRPVLTDRGEIMMENWRVALKNETRRRQEQIAEADMHRLSLEVPDQPGPLKRAFKAMLLKFANLMVRRGTWLQDCCKDAAPDAKISPAP